MSPGRGGTVNPRSQQGGITARVASVGALVLVVVAIAFLLLASGNGGTQYKLLFETGGQLVSGNQVLIGGQPAGSVKSVELTDDAQAEVTIEMDEPLHEGTRAVIRATSLSGIANRYVSITPGPDNFPVLGDGAVITTVDTTTPVDLDQLFGTFRKPARKGLQDVIQGFAASYAGAGEEANETYKYFNPSLVASDRLFRELTRDQKLLADFLVQGSRLTTAIAERRDDLAGLVANSNQALGAVASQNQALDRSLQALPPALRQANTTFVNLRAALDDLDPLVAVAKPATKDLAPFLSRLKGVTKRSIPVFEDLRLAVNRPGEGNDLAAFTGGLVDLRDRATTAFPAAIRAMTCSATDQTPCGAPGEIPFFQLARPYMPDLLALFASLGQVTAYYDANGHFARASPIVNLFEYTGGDLEPIAASEKYDDYAFGIFRRCPGTSSQPAADGSTPFLDGGGLDGSGAAGSDCTSTDVPPGPPP